MAIAESLERDREIRELAESARVTMRVLLRKLAELRRKTGVEELTNLGTILGEVSLEHTRQSSPDSRLQEAIDRGVAVHRRLTEAEGGSLSAEEAARELGMSKVAILKRYRNGRLLAWQEEKQNAVRFPVWQFKNGRVLQGLEAVLNKLNSGVPLDDFGRLLFFLSNSRNLGGKRPLDLLREGELHKVMNAAEGYGQ